MTRARPGPVVDALFFGGRTSTSTEEVKAHYKTQGFDPVSVINKELSAQVKSTFPPVDPPRKFRIETAWWRATERLTI